VWSVISGTGLFYEITSAKTPINNLSIGDNKFLWSVTNGVCPESHDSIMIIVHDLVIKTLITPNMDGRNDYFVLEGLSTQDKPELVIFDRRGVQVYKKENYDNLWNGIDYNRNPLPDDTYFCIIKTVEGRKLPAIL
jgi:gliding motility-associated-like protein